MVAVDVCIAGGRGNDAEWRDNMQQYLWRALASADGSHQCYLTREMASLEAQPLATHADF
jgi:hypothetical protein